MKEAHYTAQEVLDIEYQGYGIIKPEGKVIFVEDVLPGEVVDVRLLRTRKRYAYAKPVRFHKRSPRRIEPFCPHFQDCGGCKWQYLPYEDQIAFKQGFVRQIMEHIGSIKDPPLQKIIGCTKDREYRNKLEYSFSNKRWLTQKEVESGGEIAESRALGFHVRGRFDKVLEIDRCFLQETVTNRIRNRLGEYCREKNYDFYDIRKNTGLMRTVTVRTSLFGELMVIVSFGRRDEEAVFDVLTFLKECFPELTALYYLINETGNDNIIPHDVKLFAGAPVIKERCGSNTLMIHPKSFYQTNPEQAERLFALVSDWAELDGQERLADLYCGIGSIGLFLADSCREVLGIDNVRESIETAVENAAVNGKENCRYICAEVEALSGGPDLGSCDLAVLDPPRAGLHPKALSRITESGIPRIIYVSCNPATQARDLQVLLSRYQLKRMRPVDMFPQTYHIENVAELTLR